MLNFRTSECLVVSDQAGQNRQPGRVGRRPAIGPASVRAEIEKGTRSTTPLQAVEEDVVELVDVTPVTIDDQHVSIAAAATVHVARLAAFNPVGLRDRFGRYRIEGITLVR